MPVSLKRDLTSFSTPTRMQSFTICLNSSRSRIISSLMVY